MNRSDGYYFALISTIIPEATDLTMKNFLDMVEVKSPVVKKQFKLFLTVIQIISIIRYLKKFELLNPEKREKLFRFLENFPVGKIRLGFWGLRSMVLLSHYGSHAHSKKIGFTGPTKGNLPDFKYLPKDPFLDVNPNSESRKSSKLIFDIVIVGSGAGGGVVAERLAPLAKKGLKIAVLESGGNYQPKKHFNQQELQMNRFYWDEGGIINEEGSLTLAAARMMGGSTGVYTGVTFELPESVFNKWNMDMDYSEFKKHLIKQRKMLNTNKLPEERVNCNNDLFKAGAEKCKMVVQDLEISVKNCLGEGFCNLGCICNAKMSTLNVHLPEAESAGIELIPNCHVDTIGEGFLKAYIYQGYEGAGNSSYPEGDYEISAERIIVSAGCYGTNSLLSRSNLKRCSDNLGHYVTMHPTVTVYGRHPDSVKGFLNFPKAYYVGDFSDNEDHFVETAFYYPGITSKNIEGWGSEHMRRMKSYQNLMCAIILNHDKAEKENRIYWDGKRPVLDYKLSDSSLESIRMGQIRAAQIFFAAGCDEVYVPFAKEGIVKAKDQKDLFDLVSIENYLTSRTVFASAHPQGGCGMGGDGSVCDKRGRLRGYKNIYVADASLFPTSSKVNPCLTVMALADIVADAVLSDFEN
ncbi:MAG: hypothetical protein GY714_17870 [Desulfobacterales bacterium]|nr:hypothetical protein [Desulfobacterales bacterium]